MSKPLKPLSKREIERFLNKYPDWRANKLNTCLSRNFYFSNYMDGLIFIARISVHAEVFNHHPDVTLSYGKVKVCLKTHDIKSLSKKDLVMGKKIESLYR